MRISFVQMLFLFVHQLVRVVFLLTAIIRVVQLKKVFVVLIIFIVVLNITNVIYIFSNAIEFSMQRSYRHQQQKFKSTENDCVFFLLVDRIVRFL